MTTNQLQRHQQGRAKLKALFAAAEHTAVIHYSCESFYDLPTGRSPRITSIAIRNLASGQTKSFSIHQIAELPGDLAADSTVEYYNKLERHMLDKYSEYLREKPLGKFLHWNMRDQTFGFAAIEHRHRVIGGAPTVVSDDRKEDLSRLLVQMYGDQYIGHPRLEMLTRKNKLTSKDFLTGAEEAQAFRENRYIDLHRSTLRKADILSNIALKASDNTLLTDASGTDRYGRSFRALMHYAGSWLSA